MSPAPTVSHGPLDGFVIWANCYRVHDMQVVDDAWCLAAVRTLWDRMAPLGLFRVTTVNPGWAGPHTPRGKGLRPGEYVEVTFVETTDAVDAEAGGYTFGKADRNGDLMAANVVWVRVLRRGGTQAEPPGWAGNCAAHEVGHCLLPSAGPFAGAGEHTGDRGNVMYGGPLAPAPAWNDYQTRAWAYQVPFLRERGLRYTPDGSAVVKVDDGGRPAWPVEATA